MKHGNTEYDAVVIGGGLAGLTCALALSNRGKRVCLLEKEPNLGGCQVHFKRKGFLFESCLHCVAEAREGGPILGALASAGLDPPPAFVRLDPSLSFVFPDRTYAVPPKWNDFLSMLKKEFPGDAAGIDRIFEKMDRIYEALGKIPEVTPIIGECGEMVFQQVLDECVSDRRLQGAISGFWGYLGLPPSRASALFLGAFIASVSHHGTYVPAKGIQGLLQSLEDGLREKGVNISLKSKAKKILVRDGRARGVLLESGEVISAQAVVSNVDATTTFFRMVGEEHLPDDFSRQLRRLTPSLSAYSVYLGVKGTLAVPENLSLANLVYPSYDMESQYQAALRGAVEEMPYAISIPTLVNPSLAPKDHHILSLVMPMPYRLPGMESWRARKGEFTERFLRVAEAVIPGLIEHIVVKEAATPDTFVRYTGNRGGAIGGWDYTPENLALRPDNQTPLEGLWLTGHWTVPGIGIHAVIQSGHITASMIP